MKKGLNSPKMDAGLLTHDIADRIQLGIYIYQLADHDDDRSLMLIYANRAAEIYTGLPARKIVGKTIDKIFPVLRTRGIPQSCVGVSFKNITERKNAERKLAASNERYRNLYENTPVMLHSIDSRGMVVAVSNCWLTHTGYRREEVIGRPLTSFLTDESKLFAKIIAYPYFLEHGYVQDISYQVVKKNGGVMDVTLSAIAEKDEEGGILRSLAVLIDVTARKKAEAAQEKLIRELQKALEEITSLRGILPLCSFCKRVRDDKGYWEQVDIYITKHTPAEISHSICPECLKKHYPTLAQNSGNKLKTK